MDNFNNTNEGKEPVVESNTGITNVKFNYSRVEKKARFTGENGKYNSFLTKLKKTDEAFLNSILAFAVYDRNGWMMENMNSSLSDITPIVQEAMKDKEKMYNLKVWHFLKNYFEKIPDHELKIPANGVEKNEYKYHTQFSFKDGQYSAANGLAHASVLRSKNPNGDGYVLHLAFRGTEFSRLMEYVKGPYLDMSAYYQNFKPLIRYLKEYANNPENNITEIQVSGHSLGGAMVQEFLRDNPPKLDENPENVKNYLKKFQLNGDLNNDSDNGFNVPIKGYTFGSPGSKKKLFQKFLTVAYHALGRGVIVPYDDSPSTPDDRMTQFYHNNDPVPIVGLLGYSKGGNNNKLRDVAYEEAKEAKLESKSFLEKIPAFGKMVTYFKETILHKFNTKFHDSARYIMNLRNQIENYYKEYPQFGEVFTENSTKNWQSWIKEERHFSALSIKYKSAFEYLVTQEEPELNKEQVNNKILQIREKMKYDSQADVVLSKTRANNESYSKFLAKGNTTTINSDGVEVNPVLTKESLSTDLSVERIQRLRKAYGEKMEERAAVFKKPS